MMNMKLKMMMQLTVLIISVCMMMAPVRAAAGDTPLTQLAGLVAEWEYPPEQVPAATFSGAFVDPTGILYVTWNDGIMRVPPSVVGNAASRPVTNYQVTPPPNPPEQYDPCVPNPSAPISPYYTCQQPNTEYLGDSHALYYRVSDRAKSVSLPFVYNRRVFAIGEDPNGVTYRVIQYDAATFSTYDSSYNTVDSPNLKGAVRVLLDTSGATPYAYVAANAINGNALLIRMNLTDMSEPVTPESTPKHLRWSYAVFSDSTINDVTFNPSKSTFYFTGLVGGNKGVWRMNNVGGSFTALPVAPTLIAAPASCLTSAMTVAYDADPTATRGDRVYMGCPGTPTTAGSIQALDVTSLAWVNSTSMLVADNHFASWIHVPETGIMYAALQGKSGSGGFGNILQFSAVGDRREGRAETSFPVDVKALALSPLRVASGDRANAFYFYAVGTNFNSKFPAIMRWASAQGCLDNCGELATPVRGTCTRRACTCGTYGDPLSGETLEWLSPWCSQLTCAFDCNGLGWCNNGTCACDRTHWTSNATRPCLELRCPNDCMFATKQGTCLYNETGYPLECQCAPGWTGDDCTRSALLPCHLLTDNCTACVQNTDCVWCSSSRTCLYGSVNGPSSPLAQAECRSWYHGSCPSVAITVVNYIMTAMLGVILIISLVSGLINDTAEDIPERRTEWYLFQRAGKLWSMVYQLQLVALAGFINIQYPTSFVGFVRYWNWILLAWGFPWHHSKTSKDVWYDSTATTGRSTKNYSQMLAYWKSSGDNTFFAFLLWWGAALGVFLALYVIMLVVSMVRKGRTGFLATTRPVFIGLRILELGHLGVCIMGPLALAHKGTASAVVGGIAWVVLGLGVPAALFVWLGFIQDKKALFKPTFAASCYPYYGAFDFRYRAFILAPWAKRILIGLFVGFVTATNAKNSALGQLIPILIIHLAYLALVILARNMFSDYLQRYLEIILAILNLLSFCFLFGFLGTPTDQQLSAMGIIFLVLQFLACTCSAAFFIISWLQLNQVYSLSQCIKFCTCRGEK